MLSEDVRPIRAEKLFLKFIFLYLVILELLSPLRIICMFNFCRFLINILIGRVLRSSLS